VLTHVQHHFLPARSPVHVAAANCDAVALEMMLAVGGDVLLVDSDGKSALTHVQEEGTQGDIASEDAKAAWTLATGVSEAVSCMWSPERHLGFVRGSQGPKAIRALLLAALHGKRSQERRGDSHTYTAIPVSCFLDALSSVPGGWNGKNAGTLPLE
jgi:hypothetical protein